VTGALPCVTLSTPRVVCVRVSASGPQRSCGPVRCRLNSNRNQCRRCLTSRRRTPVLHRQLHNRRFPTARMR
jgi:hypothetical protein